MQTEIKYASEHLQGQIDVSWAALRLLCEHIKPEDPHFAQQVFTHVADGRCGGPLGVSPCYAYLIKGEETQTEAEKQAREMNERAGTPHVLQEVKMMVDHYNGTEDKERIAQALYLYEKLEKFPQGSVLKQNGTGLWELIIDGRSHMASSVVGLLTWALRKY